MSDLSKVCDKLGDAAAPTVMQAAMADLDGYWLELQCQQHGTIRLSCRQIAQQQGGKTRLSDVLAELSCQIRQ